ncbi:UvrD-helicase domain-containing protein [Nonomuraea endophytica]|uniref:UvrD-like helicase ATP-binding domain-containing protein n=1 Tax=Nonomuraea endophytica TaxID=714136 RepID=A0A7W8EJ89_9ACTN|nr:UvrD-helicase domain-containing protein [Nonomuraea endophytica]MBB5081281.1 hypothetical protein [Nonomuraea endophytica]
MAPTPTIEQQSVIDAYLTGKNLVIEAGAGAGKSSTLKMCAATTRGRKGLYLAYNKSIQADAAKSFPPDVTCKTAHSLAFGAVGRLYARRLKAPRMRAFDIAKALKINEPIRVNDLLISPQMLARVVMVTVARFCQSGYTEITNQPVPRLTGLDDYDTMAVLRTVVPPLAAAAWADIRRTDGRLPFSHDAYLKIWSLSEPRLPYDYVLLDEAQDSNPPVISIVEGQRNAQKIIVGDSAQSIYGWRGSVNAMASFDGVRLTLSQSFRFGEAVAEEANKWLDLLDAPLRLTGFDQINSRLDELPDPDAILCRTNAATLRQAVEQMEAHRRVAIVGGGSQIKSLAEAAIQLKAGAGCAHPELFAFQTWGQVQDYVEQEESGSDLAPMVRLIDQFGPDEIISLIEGLAAEDRADVVLSTAHKSKGREWHRVRIADDFPEPKRTADDKPGKVSAADAMLAYVTVTRAQFVLDRGGLAWVDEYTKPASETAINNT